MAVFLDVLSMHAINVFIRSKQLDANIVMVVHYFSTLNPNAMIYKQTTNFYFSHYS